MEMGARGALVEFNRICKENNEIYHGVTRALGLTDCAFWILYTLREEVEILKKAAAFLANVKRD